MEFGPLSVERSSLIANEVSFGWVTGATLTYGVYTEAGVQREVGTSLTETPASSGLYLGTPTTIVATDYVIVSDAGGVIGFGQYQPEVTNPAVISDLSDIEDKIDIIDTNVDQILEEERKVLNVYTDKPEQPRVTVD